MNKTRIEYCDMTFNPITGCLHNCPYCYARGIARRFGDKSGEDGVCHYVGEPYRKGHANDGDIIPYPFGFDPTFHRYRLNEPANARKPQTIFVGSMTDLFADYIPDEWIKEVFEACAKASWHRYLFLTKNPVRYGDFWETIVENGYYHGVTITSNSDLEHYLLNCYSVNSNSFLSIEPILEHLDVEAEDIKHQQMLIVGAETGNRKGKVIPKREWIESIAEQCRDAGIPLFMKNSLRELMGSDFVQETPW